jgi:glucan phosphoethanolaminetransferase (alkaline phosphatase superfamily)
MTNRRLIVILLALQLLGLLLLTQTWYSIAMLVNEKRTVLGDFQGSQAYAVSMPVTLFLLAATLVSLLTGPKASRIVLATQVLVATALAVWIGIQVALANIAELDLQLERLTGIAKTHGVSGVEVASGANPWLWIATQLLAVVLCGYLASRSKGWQGPKPAVKGEGNRPRSAIDLWDSQRG